MNSARPSQSVCFKSKFQAAHLSFLKIEKHAALLCGDHFNFIQCSTGGVSVQSGLGKPICFQTMGYHGPMHMKTPWPFTLLAGPFAMPKDIPYPPYMNILAELPALFSVAKGLALS